MLRFVSRHGDLIFTRDAGLVGWTGAGHLLVGRRADSGPRYRLTAYEADGGGRTGLVALPTPPRGIAWLLSDGSRP